MNLKDLKTYFLNHLLTMNNGQFSAKVRTVTVGQVRGTASTLMRTHRSLQSEAEGGPAGAAVHTQAVRPASCCTWRQR